MPAEAGDSRWVHRPRRPADRYAQRADAATPAGQVFQRLTALIAARKATPEFGGNELVPFHVPDAQVLGFQRPGATPLAERIIVLANVGDDLELIDPLTLSGFDRAAVDVVTGARHDLDEGIALPPHGFVWLRVTPLW